MEKKQKSSKYTDKESEDLRKMFYTVGICVVFILCEIIGGIIANSLAILSDAAHLFSDLSGFVISIIAMIIGKRKANSTYNFGYYRAEVIGALISVVTIWILTVILIQEAYERLIKPTPIDSKVMLITAILGLICNLSMMSVLHSSGHSHGAGCSHGHSHGHNDTHSHSDNHTKLTVNSESGNESNNSSGDDEKNEIQDRLEEENNPKQKKKCHGHKHSEKHTHHHHTPHSHNKKSKKTCHKKTKCSHKHEEEHSADDSFHSDNPNSINGGMKILDEDSFDFDISKKTKSPDVIKQSEETCCSHSHSDENSKIKTQKNKKSNEIGDVNELEDLSNVKKHKKTHVSHVHKHSHSEHEHEHCESTHNVHGEHHHSHDHQHDHNEEHDHDHAHQENINIQAAYIHIIGDIIQSIGVVIAAIIIMINPGWSFIDPVCTFLFSVIVLFTTVNVTKRCLNILMEGAPSDMNIEDLKRKLKLKFDDIISIHSEHLWVLSTNKNCFDCHIVIEEDSDAKVEIIKFLKKRYNFKALNIQFESPKEFKALKCIESDN